ncbi:MAG: hypothetical protein ABL903_19680 [Methylococcales bacterium]
MAIINEWTKTELGQSNNKCVELRVHFLQESEGAYIKTTLEIGIVRLQKRRLFFWVNATADSIRLTGEFSGPRSPIDINGNSGYIQSNPFNINFSSTVKHFIDYSPASADHYSIDSAKYVITAYFSGTGTSATVAW